MSCPICGHPDSKDAESCGYQYRHPKPALTLSEAFDLLADENADLKARISRALALLPNTHPGDIASGDVVAYRLAEFIQAARKELEGQ